MALEVENVEIIPYRSDGTPDTSGQPSQRGTLVVTDEGTENLLVRLKDPSTDATLLSLEVYKETEASQFGAGTYLIANNKDDSCGVLIKFTSNNITSLLSSAATSPQDNTRKLAKLIKSFKLGISRSKSGCSKFNERTDDASAQQYFQFYGYLSQQQNMMQDFIRTSTYQRAILANQADFRDKVVLDVGAGSGILSFFAAASGAKRVYAVEASSMAKHAEQLIASNSYNPLFANKIKVIAGKIEEIELPETVDVIISEPMGYMLFNERMLESYLHAKKWFSNPSQPRMFPSRGDLHVAPFTDQALFMEQMNKASFWYQTSFHGVNLSSLHSAAVTEYFRQPVVDTFDIRVCVSKPVKYSVDFQTASEEDLHRMDIPVDFTMTQTSEIHGLAFWFDVAFIGSEQTVWLSTAPTQPLTHWYQVRCLIDKPLHLERGQRLTGRVVLNSNKRQSYDVEIKLQAPNGQTAENELDLKNPFFRYTGQAPQPPPGTNETSPTDTYYQSLDIANTMNGTASIYNGGYVGMNGIAMDQSVGTGHGLRPNNGSQNFNWQHFTPTS